MLKSCVASHKSLRNRYSRESKRSDTEKGKVTEFEFLEFYFPKEKAFVMDL